MGICPAAGLPPGAFETRKPAELRQPGALRIQGHAWRKPGDTFETPGPEGHSAIAELVGSPTNAAIAACPGGFTTVRGPQAHRDRAEALPHRVKTKKYAVSVCR
jgi:hypothetical protein